MTGQIASSFRDPSGFVFQEGGVLFRQVNHAGQPAYDALTTTGLYDELVGEGLLVAHNEVEIPDRANSEIYRIVQPERVPFVSYPYEWCFSQLRDAALLTLDIQSRSLRRGVTLRDASAYNIQFLRGKATFIDTLSFGPYEQRSPWTAYRQFCQHFLAPLLLMSHVDVRLASLLRTHIDGIPLDLTSAMLPRRTWFRPGILLHIHLHARSLARHANTQLHALPKSIGMSFNALMGLIDSLTSLVQSLNWEPTGTEWGDYADSNRYLPESETAKIRLVESYLKFADCESVWDLGANSGEYSRIAAVDCGSVISFDIDPAAVEKNYLRVKSDGESGILPLQLDLTNPSPGMGWANEERDAWLDRSKPDAVLALALIHHLAIANNVPLAKIARLFAKIAPTLVIEFVPKTDSQVQRLLGSREDIFPDYTAEGFENAFGRCFETLRSDSIPGSERRLYLMSRKQA